MISDGWAVVTLRVFRAVASASSVVDVADDVLPDVVLRTTCDAVEGLAGLFLAHGVVTGAAGTADAALDNLARSARNAVAALVAVRRFTQAEMPEPGEWGIEVADVRLVVIEDPDLSRRLLWTAYGTLRTTGLSPFVD
jgi:hypothetical protein